MDTVDITDFSLDDIKRKAASTEAKFSSWSWRLSQSISTDKGLELDDLIFVSLCATNSQFREQETQAVLFLQAN